MELVCKNNLFITPTYHTGTLNCLQIVCRGHVVKLSKLQDVIFFLSEFNLTKFRWAARGEIFSLLPMNVTTDLRNYLIEDLLGCNLG
jgi:hypothetical protein